MSLSETDTRVKLKMVLTIILTIVILLGGGLSERHFRGRRCYWRGVAMESAAGRSKDAQNSTRLRASSLARSLTNTHTTLSPSLPLCWASRLYLDDFFSWVTFIGLDVRSYSTYKSRHVLATIPSFIGLAYYQGKDIVFRFIIEYSSFRDFYRPLLGNNRFIF